MVRFPKRFFIFIALATTAWSCKQNQSAEDISVDMNEEKQKISYSIGVNIGSGLKSSGLKDDLDTEIISKAIQDVLADKELLCSQEEAGQNIQTYMMAKQNKDNQENLEKGQKFLEENAKIEGIVSLENGLQYQVLNEGNGEKPTTEDKVKVHYHGTLIDGTVFDSSVERGEPATFGVTQVIKGWTEILQLMSVGSKWKVFIPTELAYSTNVRPGGPIPANATLIFEIELLEIVKESK
ncbi:FKBP-type peptidyl-prolyl cis-trans isomerase [Rapidithrix thailandica]|uniref:Peptidyl-prolyl cis-trans isomerase n=1 Tax=Rapidithrix thailandica TaxID=413964 RepID=A0AAW9SB90_9BACT